MRVITVFCCNKYSLLTVLLASYYFFSSFVLFFFDNNQHNHEANKDQNLLLISTWQSLSRLCNKQFGAQNREEDINIYHRVVIFIVSFVAQFSSI